MFVISPVRYFTVVVLAVALGLALVGSALRVSADDPATFSETDDGSFVITFGQVTTTVDFSGTGVGTELGSSSVAGHTVLAPSATPGCSTIVFDRVTETAANSDTLILQASGQDCFDLASGQINGSGTYVVIGDTGRFAGAAGSGIFSVHAQISTFGAASASGSFGPLTFSGTLAVPQNP